MTEQRLILLAKERGFKAGKNGVVAYLFNQRIITPAQYNDLRQMKSASAFLFIINNIF